MQEQEQEQETRTSKEVIITNPKKRTFEEEDQDPSKRPNTISTTRSASIDADMQSTNSDEQETPSYQNSPEQTNTILDTHHQPPPTKNESGTMHDDPQTQTQTQSTHPPPSTIFYKEDPYQLSTEDLLFFPMSGITLDTPLYIKNHLPKNSNTKEGPIPMHIESEEFPSKNAEEEKKEENS